MRTIDNELIAHITQTIVEYCNPRRIILFGSYARGDAGPDSDLDIFVEMETRSRSRSVNKIYMLFGLREWAMDVIVYTPEDVRTWRGQVGTMLYVIEKEGRVLYERSEAALPLVAHESRTCLIALQRIMAEPGAPWDIVCFHDQQSAEKVLKAFLVFQGQAPSKTHNLDRLLTDCVAFDPTLARLRRDCVRLTTHGVKSRYPDVLSEPTKREATTAMAAMHRIRNTDLSLLPK